MEVDEAASEAIADMMWVLEWLVDYPFNAFSLSIF
jgi:hypothetical protein